MCGIIGVASNSSVVPDLYNGLMMLQHRGQDAAGMVTFDERLHVKKENGLVSEVFKPEDGLILTGNIGLGHVRYRTAGSLDPSAAQPFLSQHPFGMALVHNGNLTNYRELHEVVTQKYHRYLNSNSDSELIIHVLSHEMTAFQAAKLSPKDIFEAVGKTMPQIKGAYAIICLIAGHGLLAFRDPYGIRPLIYGVRKGNGKDEYMIASESVALESNGFEIVNDIQPGQAIFIDLENNVHVEQCVEQEAKRPCIFEFVYLARPDSMIDDISVYKTRLRMGEKLAAQIKASGIKIDSVVPIPDTSRPIAQALAEKLDVPYREGLIKNRYIGRTFIMPGQQQRNKSIKQKLSPIKLELNKKNILLVDDSIVRGTTARQIVELVREAGANQVYLASGAPPIINPDVYGVDIPSRKELVAYQKSIQEVANEIGVDALFYQTIEDLVDAASTGSEKTNEFSTGCFDFGYATPEVNEELLQQVQIDYENREKEVEITGSTN
jgi:amidophosphoribosyltransferase